MTLAGIVPKTERPHCLTCGKVLKPRYRYLCVYCGHDWYSHPLMTGKTCSGLDSAAKNRVPCACVHLFSGRDHSWLSRQFDGYERDGLFHSDQCAIRWALKHATRFASPFIQRSRASNGR